MKTKDYMIVSHLRTNARKPVLEISSAVNICRATVAEKMRQLQASVILKYTALVDFKKLGYPVRLCFSITLNDDDKKIFCRYIQQHPYLNNLYKLKDCSDYFVEMLFPSTVEAESFLCSLEKAFSIIEKQIFFVEQEIVRESFFSSTYSPHISKSG